MRYPFQVNHFQVDLIVDNDNGIGIDLLRHQTTINCAIYRYNNLCNKMVAYAKIVIVS